jgi:hypothetical protein
MMVEHWVIWGRKKLKDTEEEEEEKEKKKG